MDTFDGAVTSPTGAGHSADAPTAGGVERIPVLRPLLPPVARLLSYLRRIDDARTYTNWGPLTFELEARLCTHLRLPSGGVTLASSGTTALIGALLATAGRARRHVRVAMVPAFTFVATPLAAEQCGFDPYLVDVDAETWSLECRTLEEHAQLSQTGVVVPVAPFGRAVPQEPWVEFARRTGIPVVIDGGASFETISADITRFVGPIPVALSFHATKSFSTAEGGCVLTTDAAVGQHVGEVLNFGFASARDCTRASTNGKMSEYHAAIGLAELDGWLAKRTALTTIADDYRARFAEHGLAEQVVAAPSIASCYVLFRCPNASSATRVALQLEEANIESRFWYGAGLHRQPHFTNRPHGDLVNTDDLATRLIALPTAPDLHEDARRRVVRAVVEAIA